MGMDLEHEGVKASQKLSALLAADEHCLNRVISRDELASGSSRVFYYRSSEGVPFKWERQPGTPKQPPEEESIPPLSPPPAVLSLGLPKPCIVSEEPKSSRFKLWKHMIISKKIQANHAAQESPRRSNITSAAAGSDRSERFESYTTSSDGEFMASPRISSPSSSSSLSFSDNRSRRSSRLVNPAVRESTEGPNGCSPWNFTSILGCVPRRI